MSKMSLFNSSNDKLEVEIIRYFENNNSEYLIYSLNEPVGNGYVKLYASKIIGNVAHIIVDDAEWAIIKEIVKNIIKCNHEGIELNIIDLDEDDLSNVILEDTRIFKLQGNLVNLLSDNKKVVVKEEIPHIEDLVELDDYKLLYEEQLDKNKVLNEQIDSLKEELENYRNKFERITAIFEE